jgi:hypothetical protein
MTVYVIAYAVIQFAVHKKLGGGVNLLPLRDVLKHAASKHGHQLSAFHLSPSVNKICYKCKCVKCHKVFEVPIDEDDPIIEEKCVTE